MLLKSLISFGQQQDMRNIVLGYSKESHIYNYTWVQFGSECIMSFDTVMCRPKAIYLKDEIFLKREIIMQFNEHNELTEVACLFMDGRFIKLNYSSNRLISKQERLLQGRSVSYSYYEDGSIHFEQYKDEDGIEFIKEYANSGEVLSIKFL